MNEQHQFSHEKLHVYQASLQFVALVGNLLPLIRPIHRPMRDQLFRASTSITLNIAEGNGKRARGDRKRYLDIALGSATECAGALDILKICSNLPDDQVAEGKALLLRIVSMLSRMTEIENNVVREPEAEYL